MKIYAVIHEYDVDGGFGDAITESELFGVFSTREQAEAILSKYDGAKVYDKPYDNLYYGCLHIKELTMDEDIDIDSTAYGYCRREREDNIKNGRLKEDTDDNN